MIVRVNLAGVDVFDASSEPFPIGVYKFEIEDLRPSLSQSGNPTLRVKLRCIAALGDASAKACVGKKLSRSYVTAGDGAFRFKRFLMAAGHAAEDLEGNIEIEVEELKGAPIWGYLRPEERSDGKGLTNEFVEHFGDQAATDEARLAQSDPTDETSETPANDPDSGHAPAQPDAQAFPAPAAREARRLVPAPVRNMPPTTGPAKRLRPPGR